MNEKASEKWDEKMNAAAVSVASNTTLVLSKIVIGFVTGSVSIISEAAHSANDLLASIIAFFSVREVRKPADDEHPFGHGKVENISGVIEALLIFFAAVFIIHEAVGKLIHGGEIEQIGLGVFVMGFSTVVNIGVSLYLFRVARKTGSMALEADAEHLRTDVYTSFGVMGGLVLIHFTGITVLDPIVAILVALYIGFIAIQLTRKTIRDLVDTRLTAEEENHIVDIIEGAPELIGYHHLRSRRSGKDKFIDFHALVSEKMDVKDSHDLTRRIEKCINDKLPGSNITIHIEPCSGSCDECSQSCSEAQREKKKSAKILPGELELREKIKEIVTCIQGVVGLHEVHVHRLKGKWEVHLDLIVPRSSLVIDGHETSIKVEDALRKSMDEEFGKISIHIEHEGHVDRF
ncbi:MAG: cation diffusion facilitator family transporter [Candidatus Eremiobacteraeota bacterium]|nr:cation diffusion facilitator family transporter [Candidatus Eremiobacteraeota bacterium]